MKGFIVGVVCEIVIIAIKEKAMFAIIIMISNWPE